VPILSRAWDSTTIELGESSAISFSCLQAVIHANQFGLELHLWVNGAENQAHFVSPDDEVDGYLVQRHSKQHLSFNSQNHDLKHFFTSSPPTSFTSHLAFLPQ